MADDLGTRIYPRTGLSLAAAVEGGVHDLETDTKCTSRITSRRYRAGETSTSCRTSWLSFKDGRGRTLAFKIGSHGWFQGYFLVPDNDDARAALSRAIGRPFTSTPLAEFLAYDDWLAEVQSRWKGLASSIADSRSTSDPYVDAVVRLAGEGGRPLASVSSRFYVDRPVLEGPLARPSCKLRELRFSFTDHVFFARHGATMIADALSLHYHDADWGKEAAAIVKAGLWTIRRCQSHSYDCDDKVVLEAVAWWPAVLIKQQAQELTVTIPGEA
jgi:hypothetical protein